MFAVQEVTILLNLPWAIKRKFSIECFYIRLGPLREILPGDTKTDTGPSYRLGSRRKYHAKIYKYSYQRCS